MKWTVRAKVETTIEAPGPNEACRLFTERIIAGLGQGTISDVWTTNEWEGDPLQERVAAKKAQKGGE